MIIVGGFNVYPAEIERTLLEHGDVEQVAVVGVPDERFGEVPVAVLVLRQGAAPKIDVLMAFCEERLADFKRPRAIHVVAALPANAAGKVVKADLRAQLSGSV
jgi:acyl-CoA synthetase (AMP-forming)/AMP-acid ligase II